MWYRDQWSFEKKIKKARAKKNRSLADSLAKRRPTYRIDHLVKERYGPVAATASNSAGSMQLPCTCMSLHPLVSGAMYGCQRSHGLVAVMQDMLLTPLIF